MRLYLAILGNAVARYRLARFAFSLCRARGVDQGTLTYPIDEMEEGLYVVNDGEAVGWLHLHDLIPDYPGAP